MRHSKHHQRAEGSDFWHVDRGEVRVTQPKATRRFDRHAELSTPASVTKPVQSAARSSLHRGADLIAGFQTVQLRQHMKTIAGTEAITAEIKRRITISPFANGHCAECSVPPLYRIAHDGCANWAAAIGSTEPRGCQGFMLANVADVRRHYDLPPESTSEVVKQLLNGRKQPF
jgi:hypothetical protein